MRCIVTGGAGFIGSNLVDKLLERYDQVIILDNFAIVDEVPLGDWKNLANHETDKNLEIYEKNINDDLNDIFSRDIDVVFHLAALPRVQYSIREPEKTWKVNTQGTLNLLKLAAKNGIRRFVFSSSSSIYGDQKAFPLTEDMKPNPRSPYASQKLESEKHCRRFFEEEGLETISLRYFNVYGPRQNPEGDYACLVPKFINLVNESKILPVNGDGLQSRDFIYVEDVVNANITAASTNNSDSYGESFNIGNGSDLTVMGVAEKIADVLNKNYRVNHLPAVKEPRKTLADFTKAKELLQWEPKFDFERGLEKTVEYFIGL